VVSLLIMDSFDINGGFMYGLFHNARYACRELVYLDIIQGRTDPAGRLNGRELLQILGKALSYAGEDEDASMDEARQRLLEGSR
jgi:hypothetical protein